MTVLRFAAFLLIAVSSILHPDFAQAQAWRPAEGPLKTRWAADVSPDRAHSEYPRPTLVRPDWILLNGLWDASLGPSGGEPTWSGRILVPFPIESSLSGVGRKPSPRDELRYQRSVTLPARREPGRWLLHFGAVDWHARVLVNGKEVGEHKGGYTPFSFDVTDALRPEGEQEIVVVVRDPTNSSYQPRGKQVREPHSIWYTSVTGIWQTVWLEPVPRTYVRSLDVSTDIEKDEVAVKANLAGDGAEGGTIVVRALDGDRELGTARAGADGVAKLSLPGLERWSPDNPKLYDLEVKVLRGERTVDEVKSYFAVRTLEIRPDEVGAPRFYLNGKQIFLYGPLDQGWWPDGLYTAPTDEALAYDIEITKQLGFNTIRKHVKVEPERWYWHCDRLGMIVWQDMPSGDRHARWNSHGEFDNKPEGEIRRSPESAENYRRELKEMIDALRDHPSITVWVPFNEAWGQFDTVNVTKWIKEYDPTRLVISASGGNDYRVGDIHDIHSYPGPACPPIEKERAAVLGEFGGLGLPLAGHTWQDEKNWGYRSFNTKDDLARAYAGLQTALRPLIAEGLAAAIYTQTTDVEIEVNGLLTYDRAVVKMEPSFLASLHAKLYEPPAIVRVHVPTSEKEAQEWRYTTEKPRDGWEKAGFDDSGWKVGRAGFGTEDTPGAIVRTTWNGSDIWLRRTVKIDGSKLERPHLRIHHDDAVTVYVDGKQVLERDGWTTNYIYLPIEKLDDGGDGEIEIAIHCHQDRGGQYIDLGIVDFKSR